MRTSVLLAAVLLLAAPASGPGAPPRAYLGCDLNLYPGDEALPALRKSFTFVGYWLSSPPGARENTWKGKRAVILSNGFGFALLYAGPKSRRLTSETEATRKGTTDAQTAAAAATREGYPKRAVIFLDIEEGGRLPKTYHAFLRAWADELARLGFRTGVYCSGMPVNEGDGVSIITADDIRNNLGARDTSYWIYNDACPPSPGCAAPHNPPLPSAGGVPYATIWQFARSPRMKEFTMRCAGTYHSDGNCYAPSDKGRAWFLDVNSAASPDPAAGRD